MKGLERHSSQYTYDTTTQTGVKQMIKETEFIHIHKGNEIQSNTKTFCKIELDRCKKGAVAFKNRSFSTCPHCLAVADKTERMLNK